MRNVLADISGHTDAADTVLIVAVVVAAVGAVLAAMLKDIKGTLLLAAVGLIALALALL